ncbi:MAG: phospholipid carrier-dependent glycosyltransferase [Chloroflexota bacterium]
MQRLASFLTLLLAVIGTFLILTATPEGLGLSDDAIAYIAGARSLMAGEGYREAWLESNQPVTHFPPGFSGTLALLGLVSGLDPLRGARFLNAILFGMNAALLGLLGWRMTKSSVAGIALAALFIANDSLLRVHAVAMSEPLFLFFSLLAFLCFDLRFENSRGGNVWLIGAGVASGLAYLTRYSGLALAATFLAALFVIHDTWRKRLTGAALYLAGFIPWAVGWAVRNSLLGGTATNRSLTWHPPTMENIQLGVRTFAEFLVPILEWKRPLIKMPAFFPTVLAVLGLGLLIWLAWSAFAFVRGSAAKESGETLSFTNALYIFGYLAAVLSSISLFDASTPLKVRILAPVYLPLLLLLTGAGMWLWNRRQRLWRGAALVLAAFLLSVSAVSQARAVAELSRGGTGYASFQWYDSEVMAAIRQLPADVDIYTNEPGAVYLYSGRGAHVLPNDYDPVTAQVRPGYAEGVARLQKEILEGRAVLAVFDGNVVDPILIEGLPLILKSGGDELYGLP